MSITLAATPVETAIAPDVECIPAFNWATWGNAELAANAVQTITRTIVSDANDARWYALETALQADDIARVYATFCAGCSIVWGQQFDPDPRTTTGLEPVTEQAGMYGEFLIVTHPEYTNSTQPNQIIGGILTLTPRLWCEGADTGLIDGVELYRMIELDDVGGLITPPPITPPPITPPP